MQLYCGIDLHSNNSVVSLINDDDQLICEKGLDNNLEASEQQLVDRHDFRRLDAAADDVLADIADRALLNVTSRGVEQGGRELDALEMDQYTELQEAANILREGVEDIADLIEIASRHNAQAEALLKQQASVITSITSSIQAARVVPVDRTTVNTRQIIRIGSPLGLCPRYRSM